MEQLSQHIESLIFTSQGPITFAEIKEALEDSFETKFKKTEVQTAIDDVLEKYKSDVFSFEIVEIANGYQFFTKGAYHGTVGSRLKLTSKKRLSRAALETLAVIAYKQPVIKSECEKIRGVSCDYTIQKLLEKELISITGRAETPGRPLLYGTSQKFMDYFGLKDISELPKPKDFQLPDQEIGDAAPIEELSEEQRAEKTIALEEMTDQVAAAILGEEFFPTEESEEEAIADEDVTALDEENAAEAAIDDEPKDTPSEEVPPVLEDTEVHIEFEKQYDYEEEVEVSDFTGETVTTMSPEEEAALLAEDAKLEEEEEPSEEIEEELSEEEEDAMALEIEEELKEIMEQENNENEEDKDSEEVSDEAPYYFAYDNQTDAIAAMVAVLPNSDFEDVVDNEEEEVIDEVSYDFVYGNQTDAIASMVDSLPKLDFSAEKKSENSIIGVSEKELISNPPIIDKIIEEEDTVEIIADSEVSSDTIENSGKKKL
ncbi:MAG: SMC-Scp complex subunit ScpB [Saprospiraceae bacterium]